MGKEKLNYLIMQSNRLFKSALLLLTVLIAASCDNVTNQTKKPNIIVLLVDDAGYADFGFAGCQDLKTPQIDKLANNGIRFTDAHVSASVCGPSRAGLITGRYQQRFGFECNPSADFTGVDLNEKTIADAMKSAGYATAAIGKWHLGDEFEYQPNQRGFDYFWGFLAGGRNYFSNEKNNVPGDTHCTQENGKFQEFDGYLTDRLADKAIDFIEKNKEKPFFIYWAPNAVHTPMEATKEDLALFDGHSRQTLAAMTWALDRAVGNITKKLEDENLLDNTLIFFLSDNGGAHNNQSSNLPLKGFKGNKFEGGHRVPFFVHWPQKLQGGKQFDGLTSSLDIFATCVDVANAEVSEDKPLDGVSLIPFLTGKKSKAPHNKLFWRKDQMAAARDGDFKMIRVDNLGYRMYNLEADLGETVNLTDSDTSQFESMLDEMHHWESGLMEPIWTEGFEWDSVTWLIHEDYYLNRKVRVKSPWAWKKYRSINK